MAPEARNRKLSHGVCRFFLTRAGCHYGSKCKFSHESQATAQSQPTRRTESKVLPDEDGLDARFRKWRSFNPRPHTNQSALPQILHLSPLPSRYFQEALFLVSGDVRIMQETILSLAGNGGLQRIQQLMDRQVDTLTQDQRQKWLLDQVIPFFETVTHSNVVSSPILDTSLGNIYNFIYGTQGRRAVAFFTGINDILSVNDSNNFDVVRTIEPIVLVFSSVVDSNTNVLANEQLPLVANHLFDIVAALDEHASFLCRKLVNKISERLQLGRQLLVAKTQEVFRGPKATFHLERDLPEDLSKEGPRHDNDYSDACNIQIMPTYDEIMSSRPEYLPSRYQSEFHLPGIAGLLDRHFRLLREDTVGQLRDAVRHEIESTNHLTDAGRWQGPRKLTYDNAIVVKLDFSKWQGLLINIRFDQPAHLRKKTPQQRKEWWEISKRLRSDSLVCILSDNGALVFCSVVDPRNTSKAESVNVEKDEAGGSVPDANTKHVDLASHAEHSYVVLSLVNSDEKNVKTVLELFDRGLTPGCKIVEFPGVLLPAFESTLRALQTMLADPDVPFAEYLTCEDASGPPEMEPPRYASKTDFRYNMSSVMKNNADLMLSLLDESKVREFMQGTILDETQADALLTSLNRSMALIQGPPGTGKSFTGVALVKVLLDIQKQASLGPILCVCYTNHALDQLLEDLVRHEVPQIVRMGSQSKSDILQNCNLRLLAKDLELTRAEKSQRWELAQSLDTDEEAIKSTLKRITKSSPEHGQLETLEEYLQTFHVEHHDTLFQAEEDDEGFQTVVYDRAFRLKQWLGGGTHGGRTRRLQNLYDLDLHNMTNRERQILYEDWNTKMRTYQHEELHSSLASFSLSKSNFDQVRASVDLRCLQQAKVIGLTTTGLAKSIPLLRKLKMKVLVCEEAGEVLEAHVLTALLPSLEHVILIGDHLQLPPHIQRYDLSKSNMAGARTSLDLSLFERLVTGLGDFGAGIPFSTLETQRRMHPSISDLIRCTLYPKLRDSSVVDSYPEVVGLKKRLFWLDHRHPENRLDSESNHNSSKSNDYEVHMTAALVSHLVRQGTYQPHDIAVLTPYLGQLQKIRRILQSSFEIALSEGDVLELDRQGEDTDQKSTRPAHALQKTSLLKALKVSTVDNFQGEEAKVVIISLVRSNEENKCGFLRTSNRINVLVSRAKHGMYIIGNSSTAEHVHMWAKIIAMLKAGENFGPELELQCPRHPSKAILVSKPDDFMVFSPEGGCNRQCDWRLSCGHKCISKCHSELLHSAVKCLEDCPRPVKGCDHVCPNRCGQPCPRKCTVQLFNLDVVLECKHARDSLPCWQAQDPSKVRCEDIVERTVPHCQHQVSIPCSEDMTSKSFQCRAKCGKVLSCGHLCGKHCYMCLKQDDGVVFEQGHGTCRKVCERDYQTCRHRCMATCHEGQDCPPCQQPCDVECCHSKCQKACHEPCTPCAAQFCSSRCQHSKCTLPCAAPCDWIPCSKRCDKLLSCGHRCPTVCGEQCPTEQFCQSCAADDIKSMVVDLILMEQYHEIDLDQSPCVIPVCGHILTVESMDGQMAISKYYNTGGDGTITGIRSSAPPFSMRELMVCSTCRGPLRSVSRYGHIVRRALIDETTKKFIMWARKQYIPLYERVHQLQRALFDTVDTVDTAQAQRPRADKSNPSLTGDRREQLQWIKDHSKDMRYKDILQVRGLIYAYLQQVQIAEQPFKRIWDLVQFSRKLQRTNTEMNFDTTVLQTSQSLQGRALLLRCDFAILSDYLTVQDSHLTAVDFSQHREDCVALVIDARDGTLPAIEVEAHLFYAQFCIGERMHSEAAQVETLTTQAKDHIEEAKILCEKLPGQTKHVQGDLREVESMLKSSTFMSVVRDDEWKAVMAAMAIEFRGSGHWYTCANGHPFTVGECGMPMQMARCPQCGANVGGRNHRPAEGVERATELEARFSGLEI